ncbi:MAG: AAA family ATPase [Candidatus Pacebacteria bacterium]|nr:AAA family ATPase [Candidatus Paceibacterota bacterium]
MHLKRLELLGFKSFAQKTVLDFPGGIAGIVGPNGSGKSNVIDSVRWILGEREAKNLRGVKAEDLIFAGTQKRPRMGMAQVSLTFDNSSGFFPVDYNEVTIVRRIDRDGISQYFLNKSEIRLKDIVEFFAKARLGTRGLAIINQGESDLFVKASPQQRREMIEEILGLRQYQLKKHEAERKLKNTTINAEKVKAMVEEIAPHLRFLKRQASKWEKLSDIEKDLKDSEDIYFRNKFKEINEGLEKFNPKINEIDQKNSEKAKELRELQVVLEKIEKGQPQQQQSHFGDIRSKREQLLSQRSILEKELGKLEAKLEFISAPSEGKVIVVEPAFLEEVKKDIKNIIQESDLGAVHNLLNNLLAKIDKSLGFEEKKENPELAEIEKTKNELTGKLEAISKEFNDLSTLESESTGSLEKFNVEFKKAFEDVENKKDEISVLESEKNRLLLEIERFNLKMQDLEMQAGQAGRNMSDFKIGLENVAPIGDLMELERKMLKLRAEIAGIGEIDQALITEAKETETRHNFLSSQLADLEKATKDLDALIKELDQKIHNDFTAALKKINEEFEKFFDLMFGGGRAKMRLEEPEKEKPETENENAEKEIKAETEEDETEQVELGIEIDLSLPRKKIKGLEMLSGGEKSLVSIAALFALISVSPPPFLVLDEVDAALDEKNTRRFAEVIKNFSKKTQFLIVTHNRATMESSDILYGVTMEEDGVSKVLSLKLEG